MRNLLLGIDATNIRHGGGRTHLSELLAAASPLQSGFSGVCVWGSKNTLEKLPIQPWLQKIWIPELDGGLLSRILWQKFSLGREARKIGCAVLFAPGGSFSTDFRPIITMSQNLLPFEWLELKRYGWSAITVKLFLLFWIQRLSFKKADGLIFLSEYAEKIVNNRIGSYTRNFRIIPHGIAKRFYESPRPQEAINNYTHSRPYRIIYVSIIDVYKHQWEILNAVYQLRKLTGFPITIEFIGPSYSKALKRFNKAVAKLDPEREWHVYHGSINHEKLHELYLNADLGLFASSCENLPIILLETMAAGLPIACSNRGPMPEILGEAGVYFDPEKPIEIMEALKKLIISPELRTELSSMSYAMAQNYSWERCASETFQFLADTLKNNLEK